MHRVWHDVLQPFSAGLGTRDVVTIALLSGVTEELFFRGILLPEIGIVASSLCFGALHALCAVYFAWATLVGAGMGALALATGSLVTPIVAHATYNLGALLLLRRSARTAAPEPPHVAATIASPHGIG
jgi:membrane protease YdiL (CAAX protease family)